MCSMSSCHFTWYLWTRGEMYAQKISAAKIERCNFSGTWNREYTKCLCIHSIKKNFPPKGKNACKIRSVTQKKFTHFSVKNSRKNYYKSQAYAHIPGWNNQIVKSWLGEEPMTVTELYSYWVILLYWVIFLFIVLLPLSPKAKFVLNQRPVKLPKPF